jgi:transposase
VVRRLQPLAPHLIVLEATGGLERLVVAALALAGVPLAVVTPRQGRDCATATGQWAKTDALAAAVLAPCAAAIPPTPRPLPEAQQQALAAVGARRRQVVGRLTAEQHRFQQALPTVRAQGATPIPGLEQALDEWAGEWAGEWDQTRRTSPRWRERDHVQRRMPGGGPTVSLPRLAHLPALGQGSVQHVAAVVGVAPLTRASGTWRGARALWGGRRQVRAARDRAAVVGGRHHPLLRTCSEQLLARGTPKQLALTAWMHTLLTLLPAVLRDRTPGQPTPLAT